MPSDAMRVWREALRASMVSTDWQDYQAATAVIDRAIADAVEQERALIVAWLRERDDRTCLDCGCYSSAADDIEQGYDKERADG